MLRWRPAAESSPRGNEPAIMVDREAGCADERCKACQPKSQPARSMGCSTSGILHRVDCRRGVAFRRKDLDDVGVAGVRRVGSLA